MGEPLGGFSFVVVHFWCCVSISRLLCHVTSTPPWLLRPVKVSTSSELYPATFDCLFSSTVSTTVLSGHFLPTGISSLTLFPNIFGGTSLTFWHNLLLSRFRWEPAVTFESCKASRILETQNRPIYLFDSQYSTIFNTS